MKRPSKKEIKEAIEKLKEKPQAHMSPEAQREVNLAAKKDSKRIRKQGV